MATTTKGKKKLKSGTAFKHGRVKTDVRMGPAATEALESFCSDLGIPKNAALVAGASFMMCSLVPTLNTTPATARRAFLDAMQAEFNVAFRALE